MENKIGKRVIYSIAILLGASLGALWLPVVWESLSISGEWLNNIVTNSLIGAVIFLVLGIIFANHILRFVNKIDDFISGKPIGFLVLGSVGTILGLLIGTLLSSIFNYIRIPGVTDVLPVIIIVLFGYLGFRVGTRSPENWKRLVQQFQPRVKVSEVSGDILKHKVDDLGYHAKIMDTSVIIDGRILDVIETGFLEGLIVVPLFVVQELQYIADSADSLKRARGRRGLDILNKIQKSDKVQVELFEGDYEDIPEVDSKLVKLAKDREGFVVTNDYNLNKVCEFQNVPVLNVNELANALKPAVLPGETMRVLIVKEGTERQQGVAYLDDGTMIVVEDGQYYMNEQLDVVITSALQTAAGRMIFARPLHAQKKIK